MRAGSSSRGYTIIEVMIFLAISGFMFLIAATFISGRQAKAEFKQGMNDVTSQIQQVVNNVSNGLYPSNGNFTCKAGPTLASGSADQGTNQECMFLGQVIQFGVNGTGDSGYNVYTVVGNRCAAPASPCTTDNLSTSFADAKPTAAYSPVDLTDQKTLQWGLQVTGMFDNSAIGNPQTCTITNNGGWPQIGPSAGTCSIWTGAGGTLTNGATLTFSGTTFTLSISGGAGSPVGAIGFFGTFGSYSGGSLASGSQSVVVTGVPGSALEQTEDNMAKTGGYISQIKDSNINSQPNFVICFKNGGQRGAVTIGNGGGQRLTVNQLIGSSVPGICPS